MTKKLLSVILLIFLLFNITAPLLSLAEGDVITVSSEKDFARLAKKCGVDTWSQGKTVVLTKDIDFTKSKFTPIPTFGGIFDGGGHTLKGLKIKKDASNYGLFRYLQKGGLIKDLKLECDMEITGTKSNIGAFVGNNSGTIVGCSFDGKVKGGSCVGGIAGVNQATGLINNCTSAGTVYGEHYAGGIAGQNIGQILMCENGGSINTIAEEVKLKLENINFDRLISTENTTDITDIGGITGYSAGIIQGCTNRGRVGYEHVGYNIGGIAGRQTGRIQDCTNRGAVYGRKDVGGIAGQMEPYTVLEYSASSLDEVKSRLDSLEASLNAALDESANTKNIVYNRLNTMLGYVDDARADTDSLLDKIQDTVNNGIESANDLSARMSDMFSSLRPVTSSLSESAQGIKTVSEEYKTSFDKISDSVDGIDTNELDEALDSMQTAADWLTKAAEELKDGLEISAESVGDLSSLKRSLKKLSRAMSDISAAITGINNAIDNVKSAASSFAESIINGTAVDKKSLTNLLNVINSSFEEIKSSNRDLKDGLKELADFFEDLPDAVSSLNFSKLSAGLGRTAKAAAYMKDAMKSISASLAHISTAADSAEDVADEIKDAMKSVRATTDKIKTYADSSVDALSDAVKIFNDFSQQPLLTLPTIDDDFIARRDKLSDTLGNITDTLNSLTDDTSRSGDNLIDRFNSISDALFGVTDALADAYDDNKDKEISDLTEDISDEDTVEESNGKVSESLNRGKVHGDLNVGGIVGAMAIEYDFDPEDDVTKRGEKSLNFVYKTKAVVRSCVNRGSVSAKKNCVGAVCGKADLGSIIDSLGCGKAKSTNGSYVGGIVGKSESTVRECYSKCTVSGENYVGGIAGQGSAVYNCMAVVNIDKANEYRGAVAGSISGEFTGNRFVSDSENGVDGISYTGKAEPVSYEELLLLPGVPDEFRIFRARFIADGKTVREITFNYGETIPNSQIPAVPSKKHKFGRWDRDNFENLTHDIDVRAKYSDFVTAIESGERRGSLPVLLVEGKFGTEPELSLISERKNTLPRSLKKRGIERWHVSFTQDDADTNTIHYLPPDNAKNVQIYALSDGKWERVKTETDGKYFLFKVKNDEFSFVAARKGMGGTVLIFLLILTVLSAAAAALLRIIREKRIYRGDLNG